MFAVFLLLVHCLYLIKSPMYTSWLLNLKQKAKLSYFQIFDNYGGGGIGNAISQKVNAKFTQNCFYWSGNT